MATGTGAGERPRTRPARADASPAVIELLQRHGGRLMSLARRYSNSREDAEDAYQRAVEILLVRPPSIDPAGLLPWMKTVVKHEAFAVAKQRARHGTPSEAYEIEPHAGCAAASHEVAERRERLRLGAEALGRLKPQEVRALLLRADGLSYSEICAATGWTYTKVNRCLSEGRRRFLDRVARIERGAECERLAPLVSALADGEASDEQVAALRPHLSGCLACRARLREYRRAPSRAAAAVTPVGLLASLRCVLHGAAAQKAAVVAASVAVAAGGGVAAVGVVQGRGHRGPGAARPGRSAAPGAPAGALSPSSARPPAGSPQPSSRSASARPRAHPAQPGARSGTRAGRQLRRRSGPQRNTASSPSTGEFTPTPAPARPAPPRPAPPSPPAPDPPGGEFAP